MSKLPYPAHLSLPPADRPVQRLAASAEPQACQAERRPHHRAEPLAGRGPARVRRHPSLGQQVLADQAGFSVLRLQPRWRQLAEPVEQQLRAAHRRGRDA